MIQYLFSLSKRHLAVIGAFVCLTLITFLIFASLVTPAKAQDPLEPGDLPDAQNGLTLFADRCANCHGPEGKGNGELASQLPKPPRDYTDQEFRRTAVPSSLFETITNGRPEGAMPPFGSASSNPIDEQGRWDLVAAIFSLGTPPDAVENGRVLYEDNCLACHGEDGAGEGPEAANASAEVPDLTDMRYWYSRSNEMVLTSLQDTEIADHTYSLETDELWDVIDYSRTFSYFYADLAAAAEPIATVTINGQVLNGTTGGVVTGGTVLLRGFTPELEEAISQETSVDSEGRYSFDVTEAGPDWVYMTTVGYNDLSFSSSPNRAERSNPQMELPITVFDTTEDPSAIKFNQVHAIVDFVGENVAISEIYVLSNLEPQVFIGETGTPEDGTLKIGLPSGAENVEFQRSFSSFENFLPATEVIPTEDGYADTVPVRPGDGVMNLLVSYQLPFEEGMTVGHPVFYQTDSATIVVPDVGVDITGDGWTSQGSQQMGDMGSISSYSRPGLEAGDAVTFTLEGSPAAAVANVGSGVSTDNNLLGIVLGGTLLLLVAGGAAYTINNWRTDAGEAVEMHADQVDTLLYQLVSLDENYEAGKLEEDAYQKQRAELMQQLAAVWSSTKG